MNVQIGEMSSTVRATDSQALLSPRVLQEIIRVVMQHVREEQSHDQRVQAERRLEPGVSEPETMSRE
jgi:hypothetical protein